MNCQLNEAAALADASIAITEGTPQKQTRRATVRGLGGAAVRRGAAVASENVEQAHIMQWAEMASAQCPALNLLYHCPNGGKRSKAEAARFKAQGVKAGVPDLHLPVSTVLELEGQKYFVGSLYIELKKEADGVLSEEQQRWIADLLAANQLAVRCDGFDEAVTMLCWYLGIKRPITGPDIGRSAVQMIARAGEIAREYRAEKNGR